MIATFFVLLQLSAGRPVECAFGDSGRPNVWERVKQPELGRYCDTLATGSSRLAATGPAQAREVLALADDADKRLPGRAAPTVLRGRAYVKLAQYTDAWTAFRAALAKDPAACSEPNALYAYGRAAARTGHPDEAFAAFRALLPQATGLGAADRGAAYLEAGVLTMARGPAALDDAIAVLRQARRESQDTLATASWLALALALDRAGLRDESKAVLAERTSPSASALSDPRVRDVLASAPSEADALLAIALEGQDAVQAQSAWHRVVVAGGAWVEHAKGHDVAPSTTKLGRTR